MVIESIYIHFASKKIIHYKTTGAREIKNKENQDLEFSEVLNYLNVYMIENNLKLVKSQFVPPDGVIYELAKK